MKRWSVCLCLPAAFWLTAGVRAQQGGVVHLPAEKVSPLIRP